MTPKNRGRVRSKFKQLLLQKQAERGEIITYRDVSAATGVPLGTLSRLTADQVERYGGDTLAALCEFFNCQVADLLEYEPPEEANKGKSKVK